MVARLPTHLADLGRPRPSRPCTPKVQVRGWFLVPRAPRARLPAAYTREGRDVRCAAIVVETRERRSPFPVTEIFLLSRKRAGERYARSARRSGMPMLTAFADGRPMKARGLPRYARSAPVVSERGLQPSCGSSRPGRSSVASAASGARASCGTSSGAGPDFFPRTDQTKPRASSWAMRSGWRVERLDRRLLTH